MIQSAEPKPAGIFGSPWSQFAPSFEQLERTKVQSRWQVPKLNQLANRPSRAKFDKIKNAKAESNNTSRIGMVCSLVENIRFSIKLVDSVRTNEDAQHPQRTADLEIGTLGISDTFVFHNSLLSGPTLQFSQG